MNVGTFMALSRQGKVAAIERRANIVRSLCALCGTPLNGNDYCFGCGCFVCEKCDDSSSHICAGVQP